MKFFSFSSSLLITAMVDASDTGDFGRWADESIIAKVSIIVIFICKIARTAKSCLKILPSSINVPPFARTCRAVKAPGFHPAIYELFSILPSPAQQTPKLGPIPTSACTLLSLIQYQFVRAISLFQLYLSLNLPIHAVLTILLTSDLQVSQS